MNWERYRYRYTFLSKNPLYSPPGYPVSKSLDPMPFNKMARSRKAAAIKIQRAWRGRKTVKATANQALRLAKKNARQVEISHMTKAIPAVTLTNSSNWRSLENGTTVDMTTAATANGWLANYAPATPCTGIITIPICHLNRETADADDDVRQGNELFLRSVWLKLKLSCNVTTNAIVKLMLLKVRGKLSPEDLSEYTSPGTPDFMQFQSKKGSGRVMKVLYNRIVKLDNYDHVGLQQEKYFSIFRRLNTKYFFRAPTEGNAGLSGDADGQHDLGITSANYYFVILTNTSTAAAVGLSGNMLTNYVP